MIELFLKNKAKAGVLIYDDNKSFIVALSCKGREIWIEKLQSKEEGNSWLGAKVKEAILIISIMHG